MRLRRRIGTLYFYYQKQIQKESFTSSDDEVNKIVKLMCNDVHHRTKTLIMKNFLASANKMLANEYLSDDEFLDMIASMYLSFLEEEYWGKPPTHPRKTKELAGFFWKKF